MYQGMQARCRLRAFGAARVCGAGKGRFTVALSHIRLQTPIGTGCLYNGVQV